MIDNYNLNPHQSSFAIAGTLDLEVSSYVIRPADNLLVQSILNGKFCYLLTARQMGKSSLMVRTARVLKNRGFRTAIVDLTVIGTVVSIEQWYIGVLKTIIDGLGIKTDVPKWWHFHHDLGESQRFIEFLRDVVLTEISESIVVFIDEIDTTLNLNFRDDFFAAIRAMYNARASDQIFKRLTFVLLGVATPTDLIKDQRHTPFNVGTQIELGALSYQDAEPLLQALEEIFPQQSDRILRRIFYWTNGHPYLTQKVCLMVSQSEIRDWDEKKVDELVRGVFFAEGARPDSNLGFVESRIRDASTPLRLAMLNLYEQVYGGEVVLNEDHLGDERAVAQNELELCGIVHVGEHNRLEISNQIYRSVFDNGWILRSRSARLEEIPDDQPASEVQLRNTGTISLPAEAVFGIFVVALIIGAMLFLLVSRIS